MNAAESCCTDFSETVFPPTSTADPDDTVHPVSEVAARAKPKCDTDDAGATTTSLADQDL